MVAVIAVDAKRKGESTTSRLDLSQSVDPVSQKDFLRNFETQGRSPANQSALQLHSTDVLLVFRWIFFSNQPPIRLLRLFHFLLPFDSFVLLKERLQSKMTPDGTNNNDSAASSLQERAEQHVKSLRGQESTYTTPLQKTVSTASDSDLKIFLTKFYQNIWTDEKRQWMEQEQERYPELQQFYQTLVVTEQQVPRESFWQRYEYRCHVPRVLKDMMQDDQKKEAVVQGETEVPPPEFSSSSSLVPCAKDVESAVTKDNGKETAHVSSDDLTSDRRMQSPSTVIVRHNSSGNVVAATTNTEESDETNMTGKVLFSEKSFEASTTTRESAAEVVPDVGEKEQMEQMAESRLVTVQTPVATDDEDGVRVERNPTDKTSPSATEAMPENSEEGRMTESRKLTEETPAVERTNEDEDEVEVQQNWNAKTALEKQTHGDIEEINLEEPSADAKIGSDNPLDTTKTNEEMEIPSEEIEEEREVESPAEMEETPAVECAKDDANEVEVERSPTAKAGLEETPDRTEENNTVERYAEAEIGSDIPLLNTETNKEMELDSSAITIVEQARTDDTVPVEENHDHSDVPPLHMEEEKKEDHYSEESAMDRTKMTASGASEQVPEDKDQELTAPAASSELETAEQEQETAAKATSETKDTVASDQEEIAPKGSKTGAIVKSLAAIFSLVVVLSVCAAVSIRNDISAGNVACSPMKPGQRLDLHAFNTDDGEVSLSAPWWAPDKWKRLSFSLLCAPQGRVRMELQATRSKKKQGRLTITGFDADNATEERPALVEWKDVLSLQSLPKGQQVRVQNQFLGLVGVTSHREAPWLLPDDSKETH